MKALAGPVKGRAQRLDDLIGRALVSQARKVARLGERRRKIRKALRDVESELRTQRKFLRGMVQDKGE